MLGFDAAPRPIASIRRGALSALMTAALAGGLIGLADRAAHAQSGGGQPSTERLAGHGGPIKAVAARGALALTGSFDNALGLWRLKDAKRVRWLDGHDAAVTSVRFLSDTRALSGSDDFSAILWDLETGKALRRFKGHNGKVQNVAATSDGRLIATASWDGAVGLWSPDGDAPLAMLRGHRSGVNAVALSADGSTLYSAGVDGAVRIWDVAARRETGVLVKHGFGVNVLLLNEAAGWIAYGATDGVVRAVDLKTRREIASLTGDRRPILALGLSPDKKLLGFGDGEGHVSIVEVDGPPSAWRITRDFRAAARGPIWALAFTADDRLLAAGLDDYAALWPADAPALTVFAPGRRRFQVDPDKVSNGERQFARKCSVCHTLTPDGGRRAGPSLYGVFGRRAGTLKGYVYSPALAGSALVWTAETLDKLFDIGPDHYTPGSKMPMQRIVKEADRADLIAYLKAVTAPDGANDADAPSPKLKK